MRREPNGGRLQSDKWRRSASRVMCALILAAPFLLNILAIYGWFATIVDLIASVDTPRRLARPYPEGYVRRSVEYGIAFMVGSAFWLWLAVRAVRDAGEKRLGPVVLLALAGIAYGMLMITLFGVANI